MNIVYLNQYYTYLLTLMLSCELDFVSKLCTIIRIFTPKQHNCADNILQNNIGTCITMC